MDGLFHHMRQGDRALTDLPGKKGVPKHHPRIAAAGALDELSAALGMARALRPAIKYPPCARKPDLLSIQKTLLNVSGQAAGMKGLAKAIDAAYEELDDSCRALQKREGMPKNFVLPGENMREVSLHAARTRCRTAETLLSRLPGCDESKRYINRLSLHLFLLALHNTRKG